MSNQSTITKVALPYAEALLESVKAINLIDKTKEDLSLISTILLESPDLRFFLNNPLIASGSKKKVLSQLFLSQINDYVLKFLQVLVDRRRISLLGTIIEKFFDLVYKLESIMIAKITTAVMLTESQKQSLIEKLKTITKSKQVKLVINIESNLIAGFIIQIGSKIIDTSLSGKLKYMAFYLNSI